MEFRWRRTVVCEATTKAKSSADDEKAEGFGESAEVGGLDVIAF